jgi:hypothetical protein
MKVVGVPSGGGTVRTWAPIGTLVCVPTASGSTGGGIGGVPAALTGKDVAIAERVIDPLGRRILDTCRQETFVDEPLLVEAEHFGHGGPGIA